MDTTASWSQNYTLLVTRPTGDKNLSSRVAGECGNSLTRCYTALCGERALPKICKVQHFPRYVTHGTVPYSSKNRTCSLRGLEVPCTIHSDSPAVGQQDCHCGLCSRTPELTLPKMLLHFPKMVNYITSQTNGCNTLRGVGSASTSEEQLQLPQFPLYP